MATIRFVSGEERTFVTARAKGAGDPNFADTARQMTEEELDGSSSFTHHPGSIDAPQLFEVTFLANTRVTPHAHDADEIIYVTAGEMRFGRQRYGVGSSVFIPKMTLYSFDAGPDGLTYVNFRPVASIGGIFKDEFMARRAASA